MHTEYIGNNISNSQHILIPVVQRHEANPIGVYPVANVFRLGVDPLLDDVLTDRPDHRDKRYRDGGSGEIKYPAPATAQYSASLEEKCYECKFYRPEGYTEC